MKFLVIGETCRDKFCYGHSDRLCSEAPIPIFSPEGRVTENLGMAANVQRNMEAIDKKTHKNLPSHHKINLFSNDVVGEKTRFMDSVSNQMFLRVDTDSYNVCKRLPKLEEYDAVVVSDYDKGFLSNKDLQKIAERAKISFLDTKKRCDPSWADLFTFIKINEKECKENGWREDSSNLIVTKAHKGCSFMGEDFPILNPSEVRDVAGAGDTFLAAFAYTYMLTKNIKTSILYAQDCCQRVISKKGVVTI